MVDSSNLVVQLDRSLSFGSEHFPTGSFSRGASRQPILPCPLRPLRLRAGWSAEWAGRVSGTLDEHKSNREENQLQYLVEGKHGPLPVRH